MAVMDKPDIDEALLAHYGIKGMKWGRRRGRSVTGVSRSSGGQIDRNDRMISRIQNARKGKGLLRDRVAVRLDSMILGKEMTKKHQDMRISLMKSQNARLKSGRGTVRDKIQIALSTTPLDLVMSNRPK